MQLTLTETLAQVNDPREHAGKVRYPVGEILFLVVCGLLADERTMEDVVGWGQYNLEWLREHLPYKNGIPSHDTLSRVLRLLRPQDGLEGVVRDVLRHAMKDDTRPGEMIHYAVDGKALRGTPFVDSQGKRRRQHAVHAVRADRPCGESILDWVWVEEKSNEITANPRLLERLNLKDALVSLDAMGTQRDLARQVHTQGGFVLMSAKGIRRHRMNARIRGLFKQPTAAQEKHLQSFTETQKGHGRLQTRTTEIIPFPAAWNKDILSDTQDGYGFRQAIRVTVDSTRNAPGELEERLYATSLPVNRFTPEELAHFVVRHWACETAHRHLDVLLAEDSQVVRDRHAARSMAALRRLLLGLAQTWRAEQQEKTGKPVKLKNVFAPFRRAERHRNQVLRNLMKTLEPKRTKRPVIRALP